MINDIENRLILGNIFKSYESGLNTCQLQTYTESPVYDTQTHFVSGGRAHDTDKKRNKLKRYGYRQKNNQKRNQYDKTDH